MIQKLIFKILFLSALPQTKKVRDKLSARFSKTGEGGCKSLKNPIPHVLAIPHSL